MQGRGGKWLLEEQAGPEKRDAPPGSEHGRRVRTGFPQPSCREALDFGAGACFSEHAHLLGRHSRERSNFYCGGSGEDSQGTGAPKKRRISPECVPKPQVYPIKTRLGAVRVPPLH